MQRVVTVTVALFWVLVISVSQASAIKISTAEVQSGAAIVSGSKATGGADILWENGVVTQASKGGSFQFQGVVPSDCVGTLSDGVETIQVALANCVPQPTAKVLKTGQTQCWNAMHELIDCAGTGLDGEVQAGVARGYTANGNGTITDNATGLMWEKLTNDGSIHDASNQYLSWTLAIQKITILNATNFAGYGDWRIPNINELLSLVDYGKAYPAIDSTFHNGIDAFTGISTGSLVAPYWSSTSLPSHSSLLAVDFTAPGGIYTRGYNDGNCFLRAVRGR